MKAFATFLLTAVLLTLVPLSAMGAGWGGGGRGGSSWGGGGWGNGWGYSGGYGRYGDGYGYGRYGGYWRNGLWYSYPNYYYDTQPYVVGRPVFSGEPIKITNPLTSRAALTYTLNGTVYTIQPGYSQEFVEDRDLGDRFQSRTQSRRGALWIARWKLCVSRHRQWLGTV